MGCTNCKKKKLGTDSMRTVRNPIVGIDKVITWGFIVWFFLGLYGLWSLIEKIFHL